MKYVIAVKSNVLLVLDKKSNIVVEVELNLTETLVLNRLVVAENSVVSRNELINCGWPDRVATNNSLNVLIKKLREKLSLVNEHFTIRTIPTKGYTLSVPQGTTFMAIETTDQLSKNRVELTSLFVERLTSIWRVKYVKMLFIITMVLLIVISYLSLDIYSSPLSIDSSVIKCTQQHEVVTCIDSEQ
jgi:DNA-binding winged helix-turn-helix (wHTH) protein